MGAVLKFVRPNKREPNERELLLQTIERLTVERSRRYRIVEDAKRALLSCGHELQQAYLELTQLAERGRRERAAD